jgi:molecular chaperone GrpE (heat shock protein)
MNQEKIDMLVNVYDSLSDALNTLSDDDSDDEVLTAIHWSIKDTQDIIHKYLKELTK